MRRWKPRNHSLVLSALLAGASTAAFTPGGAHAASGGPELKLTASDDTYASSGRKAATFGTEDKLVVGVLDRDVKTSFVKFTVPAGVGVTGARLRLHMIGEPSGTVSVRRVLDNGWTEDKLTSGNAPALGPVLATVAPKPSDTALVLDVGAAVTGSEIYSFGLTSTGDVLRLRSSESTYGGPELDLTTAGAAPATHGSSPTNPTSTSGGAAGEPATPGEPAAPSQGPGISAQGPVVPVQGPVVPVQGPVVPVQGPAVPVQGPAVPAQGPAVPAQGPAVPAQGPAVPAQGPVIPAHGPAVAVHGPAVAVQVPATPAHEPATTASGGCVTGDLLVPSCGVLWGAAAGGFTTAPRDQELLGWEKISGRTATIFHTYHKGDEPFPLKSEVAMTSDPGHPRVLLMNWKIAYGSTWAKVARGDQDARIDAFAARAKAYGKKFFLVLNHEPENDVVARAGSGWEAKDFAAMYRHTILRLRAKGVTNVVNVVAMMGNEKWMAQPWWKDLYPGDDVVDWVGLDSYVSAEPGYYHYGQFDDLLDRAPTGGGMGFYEWATTKHAGKPIMVAEWGAYHRIGHPADKASAFTSVRGELAKRPAVKAIVYFDTKHDDTGDRDISINDSASALAAFKKLAADPVFDVKLAG